MVIDVDGERFSITTRPGPGEQRLYDFAWLNGPSEPPYGFTIGTTAPSVYEVSSAELEENARTFVHGFFAPGGMGATDFPEFVLSRRGL